MSYFNRRFESSNWFPDLSLGVAFDFDNHRTDRKYMMSVDLLFWSFYLYLGKPRDKTIK